MSKNSIMPLLRGNLSEFINTPFPQFIDTFFSDALPVSLIDRKDSFPKYNICKENDNEFTVELSLAGYSKEALKVSTEDGILYVEDKEEAKCENKEYLYKGITTRSFKWSLKLPEFAYINDVKYFNGILSINVKIEVPEEKKPKIYEITEIKD
jgi:molecular chaperone IbpA